MSSAFTEFRDLCNKHRKLANKEPFKGYIVVILYILVITGLALFGLGIYTFIVKGNLDKMEDENYMKSPNYRKVIKEGLFFDSIEYHER